MSYPGVDLNLSQLLDALNKKLESNISTASSEELAALEASALQAVSGIRALKNACCAVNRLHPESLALVFSLLGDETINCHNEKTLGSWRGPYSWIAATHVCRYWRNTALTFPSIWTAINTYCPAMAHLFITRSKFSPLIVELVEHVTEDWFIALQPHTGRFLEFHALLDSSSNPLIAQYFGSVSSLKLSCLNLRLREDSDPQYFSRLPSLFNAQLPLLRTLGVRGFTMSGPEIVRIAVNLTCLELRENAGPDDLTVSQLLDILETNLGLQRLIVSSVASREEPGDIHRLVKLKELHTLGLSRCAEQTMLRHLYLPLITDITIHHTEIEEGQTILQKSLPASLDNLEIATEIITVGFRRLSRHVFTLDACSDLDSDQGSIAIRARITSARNRIHPFLSSFQPFAVDRVRELWLDDHKAKEGRKLIDLGILVGLLPVLETLVLLGCGYEGIFNALQPGVDQIPCPCLAVLTIYDANFPLYPTLLDLAINRANNGVPFKKVTVTSHPGVFFAEEGLLLLRNHVETVEYKADDKVPEWPFFDIEEYP